MCRVAIVVGVIAMATLAGCGGSPGPAAITPQSLPRIRAELKRDIDTKLKKLNRPAQEIACVNRNIEAMGVRQVAERIIKPAPVEPPSKESAAQVVGPLGHGCR